jgi:alpha-beta hydrolase superfamily lysophospholipase
MHVNRWLPENGEILFYVFIQHGMAEYGARYEGLAKGLIQSGAAVICQDHRGHGLSATSGLGKFTEKDPMTDIVNDAEELIKKENVQSKPWFLFGHSMGSVIAQHVVDKFNGDPLAESFKGLFLSGPPQIPSGIERITFKILLRLFRLIGYGQAIVRSLTFDKLNRQVKSKLKLKSDSPKNTWLSEDPLQVEAYNNDKLCGYDLDFHFWLSFLWKLERLPKLKLPAKVPVVVMGGEHDSTTGFTKTLESTKNRFLHQSSMVEVVVYPGSRHELMLCPKKDLVIRVFRSQCLTFLQKNN